MKDVNFRQSLRLDDWEEWIACVPLHESLEAVGVLAEDAPEDFALVEYTCRCEGANRREGVRVEILCEEPLMDVEHDDVNTFKPAMDIQDSEDITVEKDVWVRVD